MSETPKKLYEARGIIPKIFDFSGDDLPLVWNRCKESVRQGGSFWSKDMARLDGEGHLVLSAKWDDSLNDGQGLLRTGAVQTADELRNPTYAPSYGYYEAKIKFPKTHKFAWGAFWQMAGDVFSVENGAADGVEIDVMESIGNEIGSIQSALHWDGYKEHHKTLNKPLFDHNVYDGNWHTFGCNRDEEGYKFYIDDVLTTSFSTDEVEACDKGGWLLLTVEASPWIAGFNPLEGQYGGYADIMRELYSEETVVMLVEYVKVWEER